MFRSLVLGIVLAGAPGTSGGDRPGPLPALGIAAHRGAAATHPENTLAAFAEALRLGVEQIELDVHLSRDGVPVVIHDASIDRTTDGSGLVASLTVAELKRVDAGRWKAPAFAGERIPTLTEALAIMPPTVWLNLHVKGGARLGAAIAREVVRQGRTAQAVLAAGADAARAARATAPDILICNMERRGGADRYVRDTLGMRAAFIQLPRGMVTAARIRRLHAHGVRVNACCTRSAGEVQTWLEAGVDFPLVDDLAPTLAAARAFVVHRGPGGG